MPAFVLPAVLLNVSSATLRLTLYPILFHLLDFGDGLPQVVGKLLPVLRIGCVEIDEDFDVCSRNGGGQANSIWIIYTVTSHIFQKVVHLKTKGWLLQRRIGKTEHNIQKV